MGEPQLDRGRRALIEQQADNVARRAVAEQLPRRLLVEANAMPLHQRHEILRRVAAKGRAAEMRVVREEPFRNSSGVGKVAAPTARDQNLGAGLGGMLEHQHAPPAAAGGDRAHQPRGAGTKDDHIVVGHADRYSSRSSRGQAPARPG